MQGLGYVVMKELAVERAELRRSGSDLQQEAEAEWTTGRGGVDRATAQGTFSSVGGATRLLR